MRLALAFALLSGCGGGVIQRVDALPPAPPGEGYLQLECEPKEVDIYIDGAYRGRVTGYPRGVLRLSAGEHRVTLRKAGYYPQYTVVHLGGEALRLRTRLLRRVP